MSAYIVSKNHILYLVQAALTAAMRPGTNAFRWFHAAKWHELRPGDFERAAEVANLLWLENVRSVSHRYPGESSATLPGPVGGGFVILPGHIRVFELTPDPVQVLKSIHCFDYQSCEHDEWNTSEAHAFCRSLEASFMRALPGYEDAEWGCPADAKETRRL